MKYLSVVVLLCGLLPLIEASCMQLAIEPGMERCQDPSDGTWHDLGSSWRNSQCMDCSCGGCCTAYSTPRSFPSDCEAVLDLKECVYIVRRKDDPSVLCDIYSAVGK